LKAIIASVLLALAGLVPEPALACTLIETRLRADWPRAAVAIQADVRVVRSLREGDVILASLEFDNVRYLKRPPGFRRRLVLASQAIAFDDGINCPPWFLEDGWRYFAFALTPDGELELIGAYRRR
jgi:hypothetical protein